MVKNRQIFDNFPVTYHCGNSLRKQSISIKITDRKIIENLLVFYSVDKNLKAVSLNYPYSGAYYVQQGSMLLSI